MRCDTCHVAEHDGESCWLCGWPYQRSGGTDAGPSAWRFDPSTTRIHTAYAGYHEVDAGVMVPYPF